MEVRQLVREFHYNGVTLPEVSSTMTVEEVRNASREQLVDYESERLREILDLLGRSV